MIGAHRSTTGEVTLRRDEHPLRRVNPGGRIVWVARWTDRTGARWSAGTFAKRGPCKVAADGCCAQHAIHAAYESEAARPERVATVGAYAAKWLGLHPRADRTNVTYQDRLAAVLPVRLEGVALGDWPIGDVERRHAILLVDVLLREHGRAVSGTVSILQALSAMWQDALDDGFTRAANPWFRLRVRRTDPRVRKPERASPLWSWQEMHALCRAAGEHEPMLRVLSDCGLRLGELLALQERDLKLGSRCDELGCAVSGPHLHVRRKAWRGRVEAGTKTGVRVAPLAPGLAGLLTRPDLSMSTRPLFPCNGGVWDAANWRRSVWTPAARSSGVAATPHSFRHAWVSYIRGAGVDVADAAAAAGHSVDTAARVYTHALGRSFDAMREAVGG